MILFLCLLTIWIAFSSPHQVQSKDYHSHHHQHHHHPVQAKDYHSHHHQHHHHHHQVQKTPEEIYREVYGYFKELAAPTIDAAEKLKVLSTRAASLLKMAHPYGLLIAASLDIAGKPDTKEFVALKKLHGAMLEEFNGLNLHLQIVFEDLELVRYLNEWNREIKDFLNTVTPLVLELMDPSVNKSATFIDDFKNYCRMGRGNPALMAEYLQRVLSENCVLESTETYMELQQFWNDFEIKYDDFDVELHKRLLRSDIFNAVFSMNASTASNTIQKSREILGLNGTKAFHRYMDGLNAVYSLFSRSSKNISLCLTDTVIHGVKFNRGETYRFATNAQLEISRLIMYTISCANFTQGSEQDINRYIERIRGKLANTTNFLSSYIPLKLNTSSHGPEKALAMTYIGNVSQSIIPASSYMTLAKNLTSLLRHYGLKSTKRQILIVPNDLQDTHAAFYGFCKPWHCTTIRGIKGVDVFISRFNEDSYWERLALVKRLDSIEEKLLLAIKDPDNYWLELPLLVKRIESRLNTTLLSPVSMSVAILRDKRGFLDFCDYKGVLFDYKQEDEDISATEIRKVDNYDTKKPFDDVTCHTLYFFL